MGGAGSVKLSTRTTRVRSLCYASLLAFVLLQCVHSFLLQSSPLFWVLRVVPALLFLPGMLRDNLRSYIWLCFVCLLYFLGLVERLFIDWTNPVTIGAMASLVSLFISAMMYVRWRARDLRGEEVDAQGE